MLNRIVRFTFIVLGLAILWISTSRPVMKFIVEQRDNDKWWGVFQSRQGNLASMAHLDFLKKFYTPRIKEHIKPADPTYPKKSSLYLFGDSYTWSLRDTNFAGISSFHFINRYIGGSYHLDTTKRNILIIALGEATIREYFDSTRMIEDLYDSAKKKNNITGVYLPQHPHTQFASFPFEMLPVNFFNKYINQNLECNLFNYNFIMPLFGCKAAINYYLFRRASGDIIISDDGKFLFHKSNVSPYVISSSYAPLTAEDIKILVGGFNKIYDHFKSCGFTEIYLSIIPNTASVVQPGGYNHLIPLIQNNPDLRIKIIDAYSLLKNSSEFLFFYGDSHWNGKGKQKWVDMVNEILTDNQTL